MLVPLEDRLSLLVDGGAEFAGNCEITFGSGCGAEVLSMLCCLEHPLTSPARATVEDTFQTIGRREVIAALWRRSQQQILPADVPKIPLP